MKKLVTLLLALLLSLSLTVPAMAAGFISLEDETLSSNTYNDPVAMYGNTTVEKNAVITFNQMADVSGSLTVEAGASLMANWKMHIAEKGSLMVEAGATVTMNGTLDLGENAKLTIGGRLEGKRNMNIGEGSILLLPGGEVDVVLNYEFQANDLVGKLLENGEEKVSVNMEKTKDGYHVTAHGHDFEDGVCTVCGVSAQNSHEEVINGGGGEGAPASTLSQGSATVVCTIAAFVLGFAAATVLFTRKKTKG